MTPCHAVEKQYLGMSGCHASQGVSSWLPAAQAGESVAGERGVRWRGDATIQIRKTNQNRSVEENRGGAALERCSNEA